MTDRIGFLALITSILLVQGGCERSSEQRSSEEVPVAVAPPEPVTRAHATLEPRNGLDVTGTVSFTEEDGALVVVARIEGIEPGVYALLVHEFGDCTGEDFRSVGSRFMPDGGVHPGSFGYVEVGDSGIGSLESPTRLLSLTPGGNSVVGKAVILAGNGDDRLACGVVELLEAPE